MGGQGEAAVSVDFLEMEDYIYIQQRHTKRWNFKGHITAVRFVMKVSQGYGSSRGFLSFGSKNSAVSTVADIILNVQRFRLPT